MDSCRLRPTVFPDAALRDRGEFPVLSPVTRRRSRGVWMRLSSRNQTGDTRMKLFSIARRLAASRFLAVAILLVLCSEIFLSPVISMAQDAGALPGPLAPLGSCLRVSLLSGWVSISSRRPRFSRRGRRRNPDNRPPRHSLPPRVRAVFRVRSDSRRSRPPSIFRRPMRRSRSNPVYPVWRRSYPAGSRGPLRPQEHSKPSPRQTEVSSQPRYRWSILLRED